MQIALADSDDVPALCSLLQSLFSQEIEFKPDQKLQIRGLTSIINDPNIGCIVIARENNQVVGMVNLLFTVSTALGGRVALLEDMVVTPDMRGTGVGSKLLQYSVESAAEMGCLRITLLTDADNEGAHRFYQRHGFDRSSMVAFRKSLI